MGRMIRPGTRTIITITITTPVRITMGITTTTVRTTTAVTTTARTTTDERGRDDQPTAPGSPGPSVVVGTTPLRCAQSAACVRSLTPIRS